MSNFTSKLITTLIDKGDITELFRSHIEEAVNKLLQIELTEFLNYDRYDRIGFNSGNSRNGFYDRSIKTEYGELNIRVPRDRIGEFSNQTIEPYKRHNDTLESTIIQLYTNGLTTEEIAQLIEKMYGHHYSKQTISNITTSMIEDLGSFNERRLAARYAVVYLDATFFAVRRDTVNKEALHFAIGITPEGNKEVLSYHLFPTESSYNWEIVLNHLKSQGLEECLLFITDGLTGIRDAIHHVYPSASHQSCWVHLSRNVAHAVRVKDRRDILNDLKQIYRASYVSEAQGQLKTFVNKWQAKYPKLADKFADTSSLFTFLDFPKEIHASIYTTNLIEGFNKHLKRYTKRKEQFPSEDSLSRFIHSQADKYNQRFMTRVHKGFGLVTSELLDRFSK